jgi:hypothetical protein
VGSIGGTGQLFSGQTSSNNTSGPDGVQVVNLAGQHQVYTGNGNSTLLGFNVAAGNAQFATVATGAPSQNRVDEMAFDPVTKTLLAANNAAPGAPFATLFQTSAGSAVPTVLKTLAQVSGADKA